jgi:hypothetical protein
MGTQVAYKNKLQGQLDEWGAEMGKLNAKADKAEANMKLDYCKEMKIYNQCNMSLKKRDQ